MTSNHQDWEKRLQVQAQAEEQKRKREGTWGGALRPLVEYQSDPIGFAVDRMGLQRETLVWSMNEGYEGLEWDGTPDPIVAFCEAVANNQDCGVESGTGTGKSHTLGWIQLWFLSVWGGARCYSYASKEDQLDLYSWTEIKKLWPRFERLFPTAELTSLRIRMAGRDEEGAEAGWGAVGRSAGVGADEDIATKAAGMHAPHMLLVMEEMPGMPKPVVAAIENTATGAHNIRVGVGNPDHQHDPLHEFCMAPDVVHVRISALDHPNVVVNCHREGTNPADPLSWIDVSDDLEIVPGAVSRRSILRRTKKHGKGSRLYQTRVRGISPAEAEEALIRWEWCEAAAERWDDPELRVGPAALGIDVADSPTGDKSAVARWEGACLTEVSSFREKDASWVGDLVEKEVRSRDIDPRYVGIDPVGVGASAINEMKKRGLRVRHIDSRYRPIPGIDEDALWSETQPDLEGNIKAAGPAVVEAERFDNLRSQVWWKMREDLRMGRIALPNDQELFQDLTVLTWEPKGGKICVEPKKKIRARIGRSPDKGDAAVFGNFVRRRRPENTRAAKREMDNEANVDRGLERLISRNEKQQRAHRRSFKKALGGGYGAPRRGKYGA